MTYFDLSYSVVNTFNLLPLQHVLYLVVGSVQPSIFFSHFGSFLNSLSCERHLLETLSLETEKSPVVSVARTFEKEPFYCI